MPTKKIVIATLKTWRQLMPGQYPSCRVLPRYEKFMPKTAFQTYLRRRGACADARIWAGRKSFTTIVITCPYTMWFNWLTAQDRSWNVRRMSQPPSWMDRWYEARTARQHSKLMKVRWSPKTGVKVTAIPEKVK